MHHDTRIQAASKARAAAYRMLGELSEHVLAPLLDPSLMGGPAWPSRPAWRVLRRPGRVALLSDGLSDPFADSEGPGFGLEFVIETDEPLPVDALAGTWLFDAMAEVCTVAAGHGGVAALLNELGTVSVEVSGTAFPESLRNEHGRVGVLLGGHLADLPGGFALPEGAVRLVPLRVLTLGELQRVVQGGDEARAEVAAARIELVSRVQPA